MATARIIYSRYFDELGEEKKIGGIESYIFNLIPVYRQMGYDVVIYQTASKEFTKEADGALVKGMVCKRNNTKYLVRAAEKDASEDDFLVFATDFNIIKNNFKKSIAIQHGVAWDITSDIQCSSISNILNIFKDSVRACIKYFRYKNCTDMVCVDYNFINWYRTKVKNVGINLYAIPNFTSIPPQKPQKNNSKISIIFARRFVKYRGTRLFTEVVKELLDKRSDIDVTIAGEGPDEAWMKERLGQYSNVKFIKFDAKNSIEIHKKYDIAVVPTLGSEGTSLSLLEAMAAGCAAIATNVGGMTNIIIDGYNGLMVNPDKTELINALNTLIDDESLRKSISEKAYETVKVSFSLEKWRSKWKKIILEVENCQYANGI